MTRVLLLAMMLCASLLGGLTATAQASGEQRAREQARTELEAAIAEQWKAHTSQGSWLHFIRIAWDEVVYPQGVVRELAGEATITVSPDSTAHRYTATATLPDSTVAEVMARVDEKTLKKLQRHLDDYEREEDKTEGMRHLLLALDQAMVLYRMPPGSDIPGRLEAALAPVQRRYLIVPQHEITVGEHEPMVLQTRVYASMPRAGFGFPGVPVRFSTTGVSYKTATDADGWARVEVPRPHAGIWMCNVDLLDAVIPAGATQQKALRTYMTRMMGPMPYTFEVTVVGRRKTWFGSSVSSETIIPRLFERRGHVFVQNAEDADWKLLLSTRIVREGSYENGGYVSVLEGSLSLVSPEGVTVGLWQSDTVKGFSSYSTQEAHQRAEEKALEQILQQLDK